MSFSLRPATLAGYNSERYANPVADMAFDVPEGDVPCIARWFGLEGGDLAAPPSATLLNRITDSAFAALRLYYSRAAKASLFTRPFMAAAALKGPDGKHRLLGSPAFQGAASQSPLLLVREPKLSGRVFTCRLEIVNTPAGLHASVEPVRLPSSLTGDTSLDIVATRQHDMLSGDESITGVQACTVFGQSVPCWHYTRMSAALVKQAVEGDTSWRVIGSVPVDAAASGIPSMRLPDMGTVLDEWEKFPQPDWAPESPGSEPDPGGPTWEDPSGDTASAALPDKFRVVTAPLDLGMPEEGKCLRRVAVRGVFDRAPERFGMRVYVSRHRQRWHLLAGSRTPELWLLRSGRWRWLKVEIEGCAPAPGTATLEALSFGIRI